MESKKLIYEKAQTMSMEATETEHFIQWVRDNINHNIQTLTEKWTFHGMVIISMRLN